MTARKVLDNVTRLAAKQGLMVMIVTILTIEATALIQYYYSQHILSEEANRRAQGQLEATELHITGVMDQVETAVRNSIWSVQQELSAPDSLAAITARLVSCNPVISGSTVPTIRFAASGNESLTYETDDTDFPVPDEAGTWLYSFTESDTSTFAVSLKKVNVVAQGGGT